MASAYYPLPGMREPLFDIFALQHLPFDLPAFIPFRENSFRAHRAEKRALSNVLRGLHPSPSQPQLAGQ